MICRGDENEVPEPRPAISELQELLWEAWERLKSL